MRAAAPKDESERLELLKLLAILDTPPERVFDTIASLCARTLDMPVALVSLIDAERQWFKARYGFDASETARDVSFCAHALHEARCLVVSDARKDPRFRDNPLVRGAANVRAYAGWVIRSAEGVALGTLCVIDTRPREFTKQHLQNLADLAFLVERELLQREAQARARLLAEQNEHLQAQSEALFRGTYEHAGVGIAMLGLDGRWLRCNQRMAAMLGRSVEELCALRLSDVSHPQHIQPYVAAVSRMVTGRAPPHAMELLLLDATGSPKWVQMTLSLVAEGANTGHLIAVVEDIGSRKRAEAALAALRDDLEEQVARRTQELARANTMLQESLARQLASTQAAQEAARVLRMVLQQAQDAFIGIDADGVVRGWNPQAERTFGWSREDAVGQRLDALIVSPAHRRAFQRMLQRVSWHERAAILGKRLQLPTHTRDGRAVPCEVVISRVDTPRGPRLFAFLHDTTERQRAAAALREREQRLRDITDNLPVLIGLVDHEERVEFANETHRRWFGSDPQQLVGRSLREALGDSRYAGCREGLRRAMSGERAELVMEWSIGDQRRHVQIVFVPRAEKRSAGHHGAYVLAHDVTPMRRAQERLSRLAHSDPLTGLANRRGLETRLRRALASARRSRSGVSLLFVDLDEFKRINDRHGHEVGDEVLQEVGRRLSHCIRGTDAVSRWAGDEFVVLLEDVAGRTQTERVCEAILTTMAVPFTTRAGPLNVRASLGVALSLDGGASDPEVLLRRADRALYRAKADGRNTFRMAPP